MALQKGFSLAKALNNTKRQLRNSIRMASDKKDGNGGNHRNCDPGVCPKEQMLMKQMLDRKEMEQLQPSRSKFQVNTFEVSRPHVDRYVNPEIEERCLAKKKCDELKKGKKPDEK